MKPAWTTHSLNRRIDGETRQSLKLFASAGPEEIGSRISELDREWDFEHAVEAEAAAMGAIGLAVALARGSSWLLVPGMVASMMLLHALAGPYPMLPLFRRMGIRTRDEIEREKYALKAMRGDFAAVRDAAGEARADAAWRAVTMTEHPAETDRVRAHTPEQVNARVERRIEGNVRAFAASDESEIALRVRELERQWDMERVLQLNAATIALTGVTLGAAVDRRWLALPGATRCPSSAAWASGRAARSIARSTPSRRCAATSTRCPNRRRARNR